MPHDAGSASGVFDSTPVLFHGHNNGNVMSLTSIATQVFMRNYTGACPERSRRDELNRLATMSSPADASGCFGLTWTYDAWGNRWAQTTTPVTGGACLSPSHPASGLNRISDTGFGYDAAGNMTQGPDPNSGGTLYYAFDAESRMTTVSGSNSGAYSYDASGNRVRKVGWASLCPWVAPACRLAAGRQAHKKGSTCHLSHLPNPPRPSTKKFRFPLLFCLSCGIRICELQLPIRIQTARRAIPRRFQRAVVSKSNRFLHLRAKIPKYP